MMLIWDELLLPTTANPFNAGNEGLGGLGVSAFTETVNTRVSSVVSRVLSTLAVMGCPCAKIGVADKIASVMIVNGMSTYLIFTFIE